MIKVTKMNTDTVLSERVVYIGRGNARIKHSPLANPFKIAPSMSREESIRLYSEWLRRKLAARDEAVVNEMNRLYALAKTGDLELVCYCKPLACHGDIIKHHLDAALSRFKETEDGP